MAYFFCDISDINKRTAGGLLHSLVLDLFACAPQNQSKLGVLFAKCKDGCHKPTYSDLCAVLKDYISGLEKVYVLIDALDECEKVQDGLELVKLIHAWNINSCHPLVTSREEMSIVNSSKPAMPTEVGLTSEPIHHDIEEYIDHMLHDDTELKTWDQNSKELIK